MTLPTLPPEGSTNWYAHYAGMDGAVRDLLALPPGGGGGGTGGGLSTSADLARMKILGPRFAVAGVSDWLTSVSSGRTVSIAAGSGVASGSVWTTTAAQTLSLAANTGASTRYDLIVARWTWTDDGAGNVTVANTFAVVPGTVGAAPPTTRTLNPGTLYEGLVAIVAVRPNVTTLLSSDVTDMRVYGGSGGSLVRAVGTFMAYVDAIVGTEVLVLNNAGLGWQRFIYHGASVWRATRDVVLQTVSPGITLTNSNGTTTYGIAPVNIPDPGYPYVVVVQAMQNVSANTGTAAMVRARLDSTAGTIVSGEGIRSGQLPDGELITLTLAPYLSATLTGPHTVYLAVNRMFGSGSAEFGTGHLNVTVRPA